ncbi:MAG: 16S rRNA (adenine(1518)-N(6)/adenine(1519)-N(6))-dimethyltransferase RsmA [Xanthomonadales bacterium]|nr:16S rRNA (adenine(1518)-N(6)/adenine(1519)-N(6))-dimethyltransferase RsmA [Xanthomonadales bacterium]
MTATGHVPRKRFGQHFLHDPGVLARIVAAIAPQSGQPLVEIGPGEGALTDPLLATGATLTVVELDRDLAARLRARNDPRLAVLEADALTVDFGRLAAAGGGPLRLVGNLPYNVSSPILFHCLEHLDAIADMHFMLQKEVVDRMAAPPGDKTYGRLSVMLQARCSVVPLFDVGPGAFRPPPKVDSAVVRLVPLPADRLPAHDASRFAAIVKAAFAQRRKTLRNALSGVLDADRIAAAGIDPGSRAEQVPVAGFVALAREPAHTS